MFLQCFKDSLPKDPKTARAGEGTEMFIHYINAVYKFRYFWRVKSYLLY